MSDEPCSSSPCTGSQMVLVRGRPEKLTLAHWLQCHHVVIGVFASRPRSGRGRAGRAACTVHLSLAAADRLPVERRQAQFPWVAGIAAQEASERNAEDAGHHHRREGAALDTAGLAIAIAISIMSAAAADDAAAPLLRHHLPGAP